MTLRHCEIDVKIGYEVLKPEGWLECASGVKEEEKLPEDVAFRVKETLWEASHSEFASWYDYGQLVRVEIAARISAIQPSERQPDHNYFAKLV